MWSGFQDILLIEKKQRARVECATFCGRRENKIHTYLTLVRKETQEGETGD